MLIRSPSNPIFAAIPNLSWASKKVYNCAVTREGNNYQMLFRGVGGDWISRLGLATSTDGINFTPEQLPIMSPSQPWETKGCEDPRLVKIGDTYWVTYTAFDGVTARAAITYSTDLHNWKERRLLFPHWDKTDHEHLPNDWSKAAAIFPEKIGDKYYLFFGDTKIWPAVSTNLTDWLPLYEPVLSARPDHFDSGYVEMGPPPILTDRGWLVLYHGIDRLDNQRTYCLGAALFDSKDPTKLLWRCKQPILSPTEPYEVLGMIDVIEGGFEALKTLTKVGLQRLADDHQLPKAIFCCSAILNNGEVQLFYSGGDTVICSASIDLKSIFKS